MDSVARAREALEQAFPPVPLDTKSALDRWGITYDSAERFRSETHGKRWTEIPAAVVEWHHDILGFLDPPHFAAIIPAYLAALLGQQNLDALPRFLCSALTPRDPDDERDRRRLEALDDNQRRAVATVFTAVQALRDQRDLPRYEFIDAALTGYWAPYAPPSR